MNMRKLVLTENEFKSLLTKVITEMEEEGEYVKISPEELTKLLELSSGNIEGLGKTKIFKGKKIWVTGKLDLRDFKQLKNLGSIVKVDGNLDISNTQVSDISGVEVKGHIWDSGTPIDKRRKAKIRQEKMDSAQERRDEKEWDLEKGDSEGLKAHALFEYLKGQDDISTLDEDEQEKLNKLNSNLHELNKKYNETEDNEVLNDLYDKISELESEIEELEEKNIDVYYISPLKYHFYGLDQFEVLTYELDGNTYAVGTEDEMDEALHTYFKDFVEQNGIEYMSEHTINSNIDEDYFRRHLEQTYDEWVRDSPDSYFNEDDFELTDEQEERKEVLEKYIEEMTDKKSELEDEQAEFEHNSDEYNDLDEKIQEYSENIDKAQEEYDSIEPLNEPTEEMIQEKIEELVEDGLSDPKAWFDNLGYDKIPEEFINIEGIVDDLVRESGYGEMNGYDGSYDTEYINDEQYYIMRVD